MNTYHILTLVLAAVLPWSARGAVTVGQPVPPEYWTGEEFSRSFLGSYGIHPDVEPKLSDEEIELMQGVQALMAEDPSVAASELEAVYTEDLSANFDFLLGNIYFQQDKLDDAAKWYKKATEKFQKYRRAFKNLGLVYAKKGDLAAAIKPLSRAIELGENDAITYGLLGLALLNTEDHVAAESAYRQALLFDPKSLDLKLGLTKCLFAQQKFAEAASLTGELIKEFPDRKDYWILQANAYIGLKQSMKAAENFEILDRMGQAPAESLSLLGDIYVNEGLMNMGADAYGRALAKDPASGVTKAVRSAKILAQRAAYDEAKALIAQVKTIGADNLSGPDRLDLLKTEARINVAEGAGEEAAKVLEEVVKLDPLDGDAMILLGQHYGRNGDIERAIFYYERAAQLEKFEADAKVRWAQLLVGQQRLAEAVPLLKRAQDINPRDNIGEFLTKVERLAKAKQ